MQVYIELAVLENFCMDFTLLYAAKVVCGNGARLWRLAAGAAAGAAFAVVFPLFGLDGGWAVSVKIAAGLILCLAAGRFGSVKSYVKFTAAFLIFSAVLAGALIGIFSLAGVEYIEGGGFIISSVPIGIPLFFSLLLILGAKAIYKRLARTPKNSVKCRIYAGGSQVEVNGFFDSGNKVFHFGKPVSVIPQNVAEKLADLSRIKDGVKIHTVAGSKTIKVFTAEKLEIISGEKTQTLKGVKLGVSPARIDRAVLNPRIMEE